MRIIRTKDAKEASRRAANIIAAQVILKPDCVLGLATGSSPVEIYSRLIDGCKAGDLDFSQVRTVNLDEYVGLGAGHDQSYVDFMHRNLFDHINIRPENIHIPNGLNMDAAAECARYDAIIHSLGGVDLQLLGIGVNGHIGFNEPCEEFIMGTHCVELTQSTIEANARFFEDQNQVPRQAYTMGMLDIFQARRAVMIVTGAHKAKALYDSFCGSVNPMAPASIMQLHKDFTLVADEAALSMIPEEFFNI